jgi:hypothetical protein
MTGLLIKMGYAAFPTEIGVRLFPLLLNTLSLLIIEKLTACKNPFLFYAIALSIAVLQISGFVAVPDIPLIFFTALFFWFYKKFTENYSLQNTFLLGLCIALLLYSKYHAVLIVFFTLLSNLRLLTRYKAWLAVAIAFLLFIPHLLWQYNHDWISFRYHLFESNVNPYKISYTTEYIIGQVLLAGPLAGIILLPAAFLYQPKDKTEKALRYTMIGVYAFFLLSSFRGRVEANWTAPVLVPLIVLSHQFLNEKIGSFAVKGQKWLYRLLPVTLVLVVFARVIMIADILPVKAIQQRYHAWKKWPTEMRERTKGSKIVFSSSYQRASKYWFYSGQWTHSQNWYMDGRNNYNFWPTEDSVLGEPVHFLDIYRLNRFPDSLKTPIGWVGYRYDSSFLSFAKIAIQTTATKYTLNQGDSLQLHCSFSMPEHYARFIRTHTIENDTTRIGIFNRKGWVGEIDTKLRLQQMITDYPITIKIRPVLEPGEYYLRFTIKCGQNNSTHNSSKLKLEIN